VDGGWTSWSTWTDCSASCAGGTQWRQRTCSAPVPSGAGHDCAGPGHQSRPCNDHPCEGQWSCWSEPGACSVTCGPGGTRRRRRRCQRLPGVAISCHGNDTETLPCDGPLVPCPGPGMSNTVHHHHHNRHYLQRKMSPIEDTITAPPMAVRVR